MIIDPYPKHFPTTFVSSWGEGPEGLWQGIGGSGSDNLTSVFMFISAPHSMEDRQDFSTFFMSPTFFLLREQQLKKLIGGQDIETSKDRSTALEAFNHHMSIPGREGLRFPTQNEITDYFAALIHYEFSYRFVFTPWGERHEVLSDHQIEQMESSPFFQMIMDGKDSKKRSPEKLAQDFKDHPFVVFT